MERGEQKGLQIGADDAISRRRPAKSYYDLYPERKRTGPYIPKHSLVVHEGKKLDGSQASASKSSPLRRCRSGSQLDPYHPDSAASAQAPRPNDKSDIRPETTQRSVPSTYAASSIALGRDRPQTIAREPVKSIHDIIRSHSSNLLSVPSSHRGPQRSVSWSSFGYSPHDPPISASEDASQNEVQSDAESIASVDSVERETRAMLHGARIGYLDRSMSRLSIEKLDSKLGPTSHVTPRGHRSRPPSPGWSSPSEAGLAGSTSQKRGLTHCVHITVPGTPNVQVSFADVGMGDGHAVMVFLGLGASRHLIGLYDELASAIGLRLVCIDRWGIGRTDQVAAEARTILGWSFVVEQVADLLGIDRFSVLAHSAGAPFAAALALLFPDRILGPVHLLAPWTGMQQESGYRWLRYIPDGVIKTAQAAESRFQGWKLSKEGGRAGGRTPLISTDEDFSRVGRPSLHDLRRVPSLPDKQDEQHTLDYAQGPSSDGVDTPTSASFRSRDEEKGSRTRDGLDGARPFVGQRGGNLAASAAERETALDLLKASHAESARGVVDDLNLVLGKRPWGFSYADVPIACEVWHGSKDERIPLSSSISVAKEMRECTLHVVEGASHSLMTNSEVVVEVFESIRKHGIA